MNKVSIIIPIHNDLETGFLQKQINLFKQIPQLEILYIDGGSTDGTKDFLKDAGIKYLSLPNSNRAKRINIGIESSSCDLVLVHHPRSILSKEGLEFLVRDEVSFDWGGFTHKFDKRHPLLNFTSWYSNEVRAKIRGIIYLDHCIFFRKSSYPTPFIIPEIDIFEDTAFSEELLLKSPPIIIPFTSSTSSVRFRKNGVWFQSLLNQFMKFCWYMRLSPELMNKIYEKGLELNSRI